MTTDPHMQGKGIALAQVNLGVMYVKGQGTKQNFVEAVKWYRLAAEQGDDFGHINLGLMYANGNGVPLDFIIAHMWLNISATSGNANAVRMRDLFAKQMTPTQIVEAEKLAREWMAEHPSQ